MILKRMCLAAIIAMVLIPVGAHEDQGIDAHEIVRRYGMIPKGIVVEGSAHGIEAITTLGYDKKNNEFILNGRYRYRNLVSRKEWIQIFKSLKKTDNLGVTLKDGEVSAYGSLGTDSKIIQAMAEMDKLFGGIVFGLPHLLEDQKIPGGYKPQVAENRTVPVVAFARLINWNFEKSGETYTFVRCSLEIQLFPLSDEKSKAGGHLPDEALLKTYKMEPTDKANIEHIKSHQQEYFKISFIAKTVSAGEAAAFARLVRDSKALDADKVLALLN